MIHFLIKEKQGRSQIYFLEDLEESLIYYMNESKKILKKLTLLLDPEIEWISHSYINEPINNFFFFESDSFLKKGNKTKFNKI